MIFWEPLFILVQTAVVGSTDLKPPLIVILTPPLQKLRNIHAGTQIAKDILERKKKTTKLESRSNSKFNCRVTVTELVWHWNRKSYAQINGIKNSEINLHIYIVYSFNKRAKKVFF